MSENAMEFLQEFMQFLKRYGVRYMYVDDSKRIIMISGGETIGFDEFVDGENGAKINGIISHTPEIKEDVKYRYQNSKNRKD